MFILALLVCLLAGCDNTTSGGKFTAVGGYAVGYFTVLDTIAGHEYIVVISHNNGGGCAMQHAESCWCYKQVEPAYDYNDLAVGDTDEGV